MWKTFMSFLLGFFFFFLSISSAFAHAVDSAPANAPALIQQSIAFLEGIHDVNQAEMKADLAMFATGNDTIDKAKLQQAITAMKQSDIEKAETLLAETLKKSPDPKKSDVLSLDLSYTSSPVNTTLFIVAVLFILIGIYIVYKVKTIASKSISANRGTKM